MRPTFIVPFQGQQDHRLEYLLTLIDELISVVAEENCWLAKGLPASRSRQIARKMELAEFFEQWVNDIASGKLSVQTVDTTLQMRFVERMQILKIAMDENIVGLRAAIEASGRRIEAVMAAIREQVAEANPYTSAGRLVAKATSIGTSIRA